MSNKSISIYDAKTNLSKYIKQAKLGSTIYIGSYGEREVMLVKASPEKPSIKFGIAGDKIKYEEKTLQGEDKDIQKMFYGHDRI